MRRRRIKWGDSDTIHLPFSITLWPGGRWQDVNLDGLWLDFNFLKWYITICIYSGEQTNTDKS